MAPRVLHRKAPPFISANYNEYVQRSWGVMFAHGSMPRENERLSQLFRWYATKLKTVRLDHHPHCDKIRHDIFRDHGRRDLPLVFVDKKFIGSLSEFEDLEKQRLLKDLLQLGFKWKDGQKQALEGLPAPYNDGKMFRAQYRGTPMVKPIQKMPVLTPDMDLDEQLSEFAPAKFFN